MTRTLKRGMGQRQVAEDARALDGIIKYMTTLQSVVTIRDLVMTQNIEAKPVLRLLKILVSAGIVEKVGKRQWVLTIPFAINPKYNADTIAQEAAHSV